MKYRKLGNTDIDVSVICLGTMTFGEQNSQQDGFDQMNYAVERGVNFFDTAELYAVMPRKETYGKTEEIVGNWFKERKNRNKIIDSTKTFSTQKIAANLARTLAHEVKNPLSGIRGSAQILEKKYKDEFATKFLKIIIDETDRLNSIVTKILTPPSKPNLSLFNIHSALEKVYALAEADKENKITLKRDYDPSIPEINGDENLFVQAILNIVKNSQQAMENSENPLITIKSRIQHGRPINGKIHQTVCCIDITDNGPGIPKDLHDQVFFPMVSVKENGSGLGLTIAQDIIRIHGGGLNFKSKPGETTFSIFIPMKIESKEVKIA